MANTLTFANDTLTDANIFGGIDYKVDLNTGDEFSIGNTASACVSFTTDTQLPLYTKDQTNGTFVWDVDGTDKGRFYITEAKKVDSGYEIEAYDAMILLDTSITALSISLPVTVSAAASAIAAYIGCTVSGTIINGSCSAAGFDEDISIRQLLSYVAEASGCSVKIDAADHICFMYYADSGITITASDYKEQGLLVADYNCAAIDNVTIFNSEGEIQATAGSGGNSLYIGQNPFLESATNTNATNIYNAVKNFVYAPLTCEMFDDEGLEVGVSATFGTAKTLVMHFESSEDGVTVSSVGSDSRAEYNKNVVVIANEAKAVAIDAQSIASAASGLLSDMQDAATAAGTTLEGIYADAEAAQTTLSGMQAAATAAGTTLNAIYQDAADAKASANNASEYAARALGNLSTVQSVSETLTWITAHGTMTLTSDVALDPTHVYFVVDQNGDYEVGGTHYSVVTEPDVADISTYYELSIDESLNNYVGTHLAVTLEGLWLLPDAGGNKVLIATGQGSTYTTAGTYIIGKVNNVDTVLASFLASGATIGQNANGCSRTEISTSGMQIIQRYDNADVPIANLGYGLCNTESGTTVNAPYYTLGRRVVNSAVGNYSVAEGTATTASGSHSHAEGFGTTASGKYSHAEGSNTHARGDYSHTEGMNTTVEDNAHYSHAGGLYTRSAGVAQTVVGKYNTRDTQSLFIVGNGSDADNTSNAFKVGQTGDITVKNHASPIGTVKYAQLTSNKSVPNNKGTMLTSISLEAGVWVVACGVRWATNNSGWRRMNLTTTSGATDIQFTVHPVQSEYTQAIFTRILEVASTTTYYLNAYQNSGSAINALGASGTNYGTYITATRII